MKRWTALSALLCAAAAWAAPATAPDADMPGADVASLLALARANNLEVAAMRHEADAAQQRMEQADALPDPRLKFELLDLTRMGAQSPSLWPGDVGSTRYTLSQELPWFGTRALNREQAGYAAQGAQAQVVEGPQQRHLVHQPTFTICTPLLLMSWLYRLSGYNELTSFAAVSGGISVLADS